MPFKSKAQERFLAAHPEKLGGWKAFEEWAHSTPKNIPEKKTKEKKDG
jgi:hypothetical protein